MGRKNLHLSVTSCGLHRGAVTDFSDIIKQEVLTFGVDKQHPAEVEDLGHGARVASAKQRAHIGYQAALQTRPRLATTPTNTKELNTERLA